MPSDARLQFPATTRNRAPLCALLARVFATPVRSVLEVASGSGEHAVHFCAAMPWLRWQPTDPELAHLRSIDAWREEADLPNLLPARPLDVCGPPWEGVQVDALFCANMVHIAPPEATVGLFAHARALVAPGGPLVLYGPFLVLGRHTAESNARFDASLRARDPRWGVRDVEELCEAASGFGLEQRVAMPANNFCLVFRRQAGPGGAPPR